jgi:hypothetical protein
MATRADVRRFALALPETTEAADRFAFSVAGKGFAWSWMERVEPKRPRVENPEVIAVRVAGELDKEPLIEMRPDVFFTEPHYDGFPAILVRLPAIDLDLLGLVLEQAWRCQAPGRLRDRPADGSAG